MKTLIFVTNREGISKGLLKAMALIPQIPTV